MNTDLNFTPGHIDTLDANHPAGKLSPAETLERSGWLVSPSNTIGSVEAVASEVQVEGGSKMHFWVVDFLGQTIEVRDEWHAIQMYFGMLPHNNGYTQYRTFDGIVYHGPQLPADAIPLTNPDGFAQDVDTWTDQESLGRG